MLTASYDCFLQEVMSYNYEKRKALKTDNNENHLSFDDAAWYVFRHTFNYVPMVGIIMAFRILYRQKDFWIKVCGPEAFIYMFKLPDIAKVVRNTVVIALGKLLLEHFGYCFAILLNEIHNKFLKNCSNCSVPSSFSFMGCIGFSCSKYV